MTVVHIVQSKVLLGVSLSLRQLVVNKVAFGDELLVELKVQRDLLSLPSLVLERQVRHVKPVLKRDSLVNRHSFNGVLNKYDTFHIGLSTQRSVVSCPALIPPVACLFNTHSPQSSSSVSIFLSPLPLSIEWAFCGRHGKGWAQYDAPCLS